MIENINIAVPNEYLMTGMSVYNFYAAAEYQDINPLLKRVV